MGADYKNAVVEKFVEDDLDEGEDFEAYWGGNGGVEGFEDEKHIKGDAEGNLKIMGTLKSEYSR